MEQTEDMKGNREKKKIEREKKEKTDIIGREQEVMGEEKGNGRKHERRKRKEQEWNRATK